MKGVKFLRPTSWGGNGLLIHNLSAVFSEIMDSVCLEF